MPPKARFTKEQITQAALVVVSQKGVQALTAKELGAALGTSTTPIFTVFSSMQEVHDTVKDAAMAKFEEYADKLEPSQPIFKQVGMQMILFAKEEPKLYQFLFMSPNEDAQSFDDIYCHIGPTATECIRVIGQEYGLNAAEAKVLFEHVWIHTFGVGTLCATGMCNFSVEKISEMLSEDFIAMMMLIKSGKLNLK